jgi:DNA-binding FadR family transcriptional regulator
MGLTNHTEETAPVAGDAVAAALSNLISERRYRSGDRLPTERELAAALQVSRASVREGISRLAREGTIIARRGSGTFVAPVRLRDVFDVRLQLEPFAAGEAARLRSTEDLAALRVLLSTLEAHVGDAPAFAATDARVHSLIARIAGNQVLVDVLERLALLTEISRAVTATEEKTRAATLRHMRTLVAAVRRRDVQGASAAMLLHLQQVLETTGSES